MLPVSHWPEFRYAAVRVGQLVSESADLFLIMETVLVTCHSDHAMGAGLNGQSPMEESGESK